jgi:hypothetical protein
LDHPTGDVPRKVILVGLGPSKSEYMDLMASDAVRIEHDEVWGVNGAGNVIRVDCSFAMDDYLACVNRTPNLARFFENADHPVFTSFPRTPNAIPYPLQEVLSMRGARPYFDGSVSYVAAYAKLIGLDELTIFGCDYLYGGVGRMHPRQIDIVTRYMACMSYWLGQCEAGGMKVVVCPSSPLLNADYTLLEQFYGYVIKPHVNMGYTPDKSKSHLGGSMGVCHTDAGALKYMRDTFNVSSMLDLGCGTGDMCHTANEYGIEWTGVDGDEIPRKMQTIDHDYTLAPYTPDRTFELGWAVEFLEHVDELYINNYMASFKQCRYVVVTAAPPGAPGHHHVNCQDEAYWVNKFYRHGFKHLEDHSVNVRNASTMERDFMRNTGMVFKNIEWRG